MKTHTVQTALALLLSFSANLVLAESAPQVIDIPLSRPGEPVNLEMDIISARIEVVGEDRQDASFEVSVLDGTRNIVTPSGTQQLKTGAYSVEVEEADNTISIDTDWRANKVSVLARVPQGGALRLPAVR